MAEGGFPAAEFVKTNKRATLGAALALILQYIQPAYPAILVNLRPEWPIYRLDPPLSPAIARFG